jgi:hypothetical protein
VKCWSDYNVVTFDKIFDLQSIEQVLGSAGAATAPERVLIKRYRVGHGMIGTVLIAFAGEPLTIFVLIAR